MLRNTRRLWVQEEIAKSSENDARVPLMRSVANYVPVCPMVTPTDHDEIEDVQKYPTFSRNNPVLLFEKTNSFKSIFDLEIIETSQTQPRIISI